MPSAICRIVSCSLQPEHMLFISKSSGSPTEEQREHVDNNHHVAADCDQIHRQPNHAFIIVCRPHKLGHAQTDRESFPSSAREEARYENRPYLFTPHIGIETCTWGQGNLDIRALTNPAGRGKLKAVGVKVRLASGPPASTDTLTQCRRPIGGGFCIE
jgi:hypothetical protein